MSWEKLPKQCMFPLESVTIYVGEDKLSSDMSKHVRFWVHRHIAKEVFAKLRVAEKYNLRDLAADSWVYIKIVKGMYGLPQAGKIANDLLQKRLKEHGYHQCQFTPGLYKHVWRPVTFTLVVDDFGVKFVGDQHANHLKNTLERYYDITVDWSGNKYIGITLDWDYKNRTLETSVPGYVKKALHELVSEWLVQ